jgi:DNA mismatch repair protein MLH1
LLYGHAIGKELLHAKVSSPKKTRKRGKRYHNESDNDEEEEEDRDDPESWTAEAHFTNANYQAKKTVFLLFINRA